MRTPSWMRAGSARGRFLGIALAVLLLPATALGATREQPTLFLAWHAPYGDPRARATLETACDDTLVTDTLYLSFELGRPVPAVTAFEGALVFHPAAGDSLRNFWSFKSGTPNGGNMFIDFAPFHDVPHVSPWLDHGVYEVKYDRVGTGGRLELENYMPFDLTFGLDPGVRYCFARVRIQHRRVELPGCRQSVCVEWASAGLGFATGRNLVVRGGEQRLVRWNPGQGADCALPRTGSLAKPWTPKSRR